MANFQEECLHTRCFRISIKKIESHFPLPAALRRKGHGDVLGVNYRRTKIIRCMGWRMRDNILARAECQYICCRCRSHKYCQKNYYRRIPCAQKFVPVLFCRVARVVFNVTVSNCDKFDKALFNDANKRKTHGRCSQFFSFRNAHTIRIYSFES